MPEADAAPESPFEMFTRQPGPASTPPTARFERGGEAGPRELEIETTAYTPPDIYTPAAADDVQPRLAEELPAIDLTQEFEPGSSAEQQTPPVDPTAELGYAWEPEFEAEPEPVPEPELSLEPESSPEPALEPALELEPEPQPNRNTAGAGIGGRSGTGAGTGA